MTDILAKIEASKRAEIAASKVAVPPADVERRAAAAPPARGFLAAIERTIAAGSAPVYGRSSTGDLLRSLGAR